MVLQKELEAKLLDTSDDKEFLKKKCGELNNNLDKELIDYFESSSDTDEVDDADSKNYDQVENQPDSNIDQLDDDPMEAASDDATSF
ncbi:hypothetical protein ACLKA6_019110 [Drosophila palustris]